jgi:hypothetical protein
MRHSVRISASLRARARVCVCVCVCMYVCMYVLCVYLCMYVSMYECVCVCVCMYTCQRRLNNPQMNKSHTHTHTHTQIYRPYRKNVLSYHWPQAINLFHDENIFILGLETLVSELCSLASRLK